MPVKPVAVKQTDLSLKEPRIPGLSCIPAISLGIFALAWREAVGPLFRNEPSAPAIDSSPTNTRETEEFVYLRWRFPLLYSKR